MSEFYLFQKDYTDRDPPFWCSCLVEKIEGEKAGVLIDAKFHSTAEEGRSWFSEFMKSRRH